MPKNKIPRHAIGIRLKFNGALRFNGGVGTADDGVTVEVHVESGFNVVEAVGAS